MARQKERMLAGEYYIADDPEIKADQQRAADLVERYNTTRSADTTTRRALLSELFDELGEDVDIRPPLYLDYGFQTTIGPRTFLNFGTVLLDVARITIGSDVQFGPYVQLLTPTHPLEPEPRLAKYEAAKPITIGDNVWLGGGAIVCPGVTIGDNTIVGAGAVVTRDIPANSLATGNPARVTREL